MYIFYTVYLPGEEVTVPAAQRSQESAAADPENEPAGQTVQFMLPSPVANDPASQSVQAVLPR